MSRPCCRTRTLGTSPTWLRVSISIIALALVAGAGLLLGARQVQATPAAAPASQGPPAPGPQLPTLRLYGESVVCSTCDPGQANRRATAGSETVTDTNTGRVPEDPPYTDPEGPFNPLSGEAPRFDYVTWNPAWIYEFLDGIVDDWPGLEGADEVSRGSNIRIGGINGSEKVWLRHWYEPTHLDKDLNADDCLTDDDIDGEPDARLNPDDAGADEDEWYPAIMTEITYMLLDNDVPQAMPDPADLDDSAPRPACGAAGSTRFVFPVGTFADALDPGGALEGYGLTSLDADFDGDIDMVSATSEELLAADLGVDIDFDGDGVLETIDAGGPLSCDSLVVLHTDATTIGAGDSLQFLDHYVNVRSVSDNSATLEVWYNGDLIPRLVQSRAIGVGAVALAGDVGPLQLLPAGGGNLGSVPIGAWFVQVQEADPRDGTATLVVGRALGAPCASMEAGPNVTNLSPGGPWFLKRFYVDGHEYNTVAIMTCDPDELQYITLRAPLPKVPVTIEQHSVRLRPYDPEDALALPPPFNYEHTILEDVVSFEDFPDLNRDPGDEIDRPNLLYMGGPIGPVPPILSDADDFPYEGRDPNDPVGPYDTIEDLLSMRWFYVEEDVEEAFVGQLKEKYGAPRRDSNQNPPDVPSDFFYNEQIFTRPYNYTSFYLPNLADPDPDPVSGEPSYEPDNYYVTSGWTNPTARWRRWSMPDDGVPDEVPPVPPDLTDDNTGYDPLTGVYGAPRRASFRYDPDEPEAYFIEQRGVRLYGGYPLIDPDEISCENALSRPGVVFGAGDIAAATDVAGYPVEVLPYTDPFAPFNPQHPDAPRSDSLTFNPAYMDEFRNFGEDLRLLYAQLSNNAQNAREKVYHRAWYQPDYITKIRDADDCDDDLSFLAMMQEFTYLMMDTTDNPVALPPGTSRIGFPMATRADELPRPNAGGTLPAGGEFGYGLTTFDADFDGFPEAMTIHSEQSLNAFLDTQWQANRPSIPGLPMIPLAGPVLDFDGDGVDDELDEDCVPLNGNEMVVFALESLTLDVGDSAMVLDHLLTLENITAQGNAQVRFYFTGGSIAEARPEAIGGVRSLEVGDAAIVDRFQDSVQIVSPGQMNAGTDGAWFAFVEDVNSGSESVTVTIGRALGAAGSAIDDGNGGHDLEPGDPWYLKRFYVDGHEYNVVALMTQTPVGADPTDPAECNDNFVYITIRTPVPKGNFFNPQDSLFQQGYFLDGLPERMSVMPPHNVDHTIAVDVERVPAEEFAWANGLDSCVGELAPAGPLEETILAEEREGRFGTELRETYNDTIDPPRDEEGWETHQTIVTPSNYTTIAVPEDQQYLLTLNWRSPVSRLSFWGCTRADPGPFDEDNPPGLSHDDVAAAAFTWRDGIVPPVNQVLPPQTMDELDNGDPSILPYYDAACAIGESQRVKVFYDPADPDDLYTEEVEGDFGFLEADIEVLKRALTLDPQAGDEVSYRIQVFNNGPDPVDEILVEDVLPSGASYVSDTDSCVPDGGGNLDCVVPGPFLAGQNGFFDLVLRLDPDLATDTAIVNLARARAPLAIDPDPSNNEDDAELIVSREADLRLEKVVSDGSPFAGQTFRYRFTIHNDGPSDVNAVKLTDEIPFTEGVSYVSDTGGGACVLWGNEIFECFWDELAAGDSISVDLIVELAMDVPPGTVIQNTADVVGGSPDPNPANNTDDAFIVTEAQADLSLTKTADRSTVAAGEEIEYTIEVANAGPSDAPGVFFVDEIPANTTFVSAVGASCSGVLPGNTGTLTCQLGTIMAGDSRQVLITVLVDPDAPAGVGIANSATVDAPGVSDPDDGNDEGDAPVVDVEVVHDLRLLKTGPAEVAPGETFDWSLTAFNDGPSDAEDVTVMDTLPVGLSYVSSAGAACAPAGGQDVLCQLGDIPAGGSLAFTIRVEASLGLTDGVLLVNFATVDAPGDDPNGANNIDQAQTTVRVQADLSIIKTIVDPPAVAGETLTYEITVFNAGPATATGVQVMDTLPAGTSYLGSTGSCNENPPASGQLLCTLLEIPPGGNSSFEITVLIDENLPPGTTILNTVSVDANEDDPNPGGDDDESETTTESRADLRLVKDAGPSPAVPGETAMYTVTVTNGGPSTALDVEVVDTLPAGTSFVSASGAACVEAPVGTLTCDLGDMTAGQTIVFMITVDVAADVPDGVALVNTATATSPTDDPNGANNTDTANLVTERRADLRIGKSASGSPVAAGGLLTYTVTVDNDGPSDAANVVVVDQLPAGMTHVSNTGGCVQTPPPVGELTCALGAIPAGGSVVFEIVVLVDPAVPAGTTLTNEIRVTSPDDPNPGNDGDDEDVLVETEADLSILKSAPAEVMPGADISYQIIVANGGPSDALNVMVVDQLPALVTYVSAVGAACVEGPVGTITCDLGTVPAAGLVGFTINGTVSGAAPEGTILTNNVMVTSDTPEAMPGDESDAADTEVIFADENDLRLVKDALEPNPAAGEVFDFEIMVTNGGPMPASNVVVTDTLPAGLTYVDDSDSCVEGPVGTLVCSLGALGVGATSSFTIAVQAAPFLSEGTVLTNVAETGADLPDPDLANNQDTADVTITRRADLQLTKDDAVDPVNAGELLTYTLTVTNLGPSSSAGIVLTDTLPAGVTYVSSTGMCVEGPVGTIVCNVGALAAGAPTSIDIVVRVDSDLNVDQLFNQAEVGAAVPDPDLGNNDAVETTDVSTSADLALTKTASADILPPGETLTYTLTVENLGPSDAIGVIISDTLPAGVTYVTDSAGCDTSMLPVIECDMGNLPAGGQMDVTITVQIDGGTQIGEILTNLGEVTSPTDDPVPGNDTDDASTEVGPLVDLRVSKSAFGEIETSGGIVLAPDAVTAGRRLTYTLTVGNGGPSTASNVLITDTLPAGVSFVSASGGGASCAHNAGVVTCDIASLGAGATAVITVVVDVAPDAGPGILINRVAVDADEPDADAGNDEAENQTTVSRSADLVMSKSVDPSDVLVGDTVTFTLTATNLGPSQAEDVRITDTLPAGLVYSSDDGGCDTSNLPEIRCTIGSLAPGASGTVLVTAVVQPGTEGQQIENVGWVTAATPDPDDANDSDDAIVDVVGAIDLTLSKTGQGEVVVDGSPPTTELSSSLVTAGLQVTYTLAITNSGPSAASVVVLTDTLPISTSVSSAPGCSEAGGVLTCNLGALAAGASTSVTVVLDVDPAAPQGTVLDNVAGVDSPAEVDTNPADNTDQYSIDVNSRADLAVIKQASPSMVATGGLVTFTLTAANAGPSVAWGVTISDTLPISLTYQSHSGASCDTGALPLITCDLGDLPPGANAMVEIVALVEAGLEGQVITNQVSVELDANQGADPDPSNNDSDDMVTVDPAVDLSVVKSGLGELYVQAGTPLLTLSPTQVVAGGRLTYTLSVTNDGPNDASGVVLTDTLPLSVTLVSNGGCAVALPTLTCNLGALAVGATELVTVVVEVDAFASAGLILANDASVTADEMELDLADNMVTLETEVLRQADLALTKSVEPGAVLAGDLVTYTLSVQNLGPSVAAGLSISDTLPISVTYLSHLGGVCDVLSLPLFSCDFGDLDPLASASVDIVGLVLPGLEGQVVSNTASVALGVGEDPGTDNDTDDASFEVLGDADLAISKSVEPSTVMPGEALTFTLAITNQSATKASMVYVTDTLPMAVVSDVAYVGASVGGCSDDGGGIVTCAVGDVLAGESRTIELYMQLSPDILVASFDNAATVVSQSPDPNFSDNNAQVTVSVSFFDVITLSLDDSLVATLSWDAAPGAASRFVIEASGGGSPFVPVGELPATDLLGGGAEGASAGYRWSSPPLVADTDYVFRVVGVDDGRDGGRVVWSSQTELRTPARPGDEVACYDGQIYVQGRSDHGGVAVTLDGIPVTATGREGAFGFCGAAPGRHGLGTWLRGYLPASGATYVEAGTTEEIPYTTLLGGDVDGDGQVGLVDLVRTGAAFGTEPPADAAADLTADGRVNLFDLVLLASNFDRVGPARWGPLEIFRGDEESGAQPYGRLPGGLGVLEVEGLGEQLGLRTRALDDGRVAVDVTARGVRDLYGAELSLRYDPEQARVVDADARAPGVQVAPGPRWEGEGSSFTARNEVTDDGAFGRVRFAVTRKNPAGVLRGDVVIATILLEPLVEGEDPSWTLESARLLTRGAAPIEVMPDGSDLRAPVDWTRYDKTIFLPVVRKP